MEKKSSEKRKIVEKKNNTQLPPTTAAKGKNALRKEKIKGSKKSSPPNVSAGPGGASRGVPPPPVDRLAGANTTSRTADLPLPVAQNLATMTADEYVDSSRVQAALDVERSELEPPRIRPTPSGAPPLAQQLLRGVKKVMFYEACQRYRPCVNEKHLDVIKSLNKLGISVFPKAEDRSCLSSHPVSAKVRLVATVKAIEFLESKFIRFLGAEIWSIYGGSRDIEIMKTLNHQVWQEELVNLVIFQDPIVPSDFGRLCDGVSFTTEFQHKQPSLLMVDIYMDGAGPFRPESFRDRLMIGGTAAWVGHCFCGAAGTVYGEGAWWRDLASGMIMHRPDEHSPISTPHDPCDWIWTTSVFDFGDGTRLCWYVKHTIGAGMLVVAFHRTENKIIDAGISGTGAQYQFSHVEVPVFESESWIDYFKLKVLPLQWVAKYCPRKRVVVCDAIVRDLRSYYAGRPRNANLLRQIVNTVNAEVKKTDAAVLLRCFPDQTKDLVFHTALCVFAGELESEALGWLSLLSDKCDIMNAYNQSLVGKSLSPPKPYFKPVQCGLALAALVLVWKMRPVVGYALKRVSVGKVTQGSLIDCQGSWSPMIRCFLSPIVEEAIKRGMGPLGYLFGPAELVGKLCRYPLWSRMGVVGALGCLGMHSLALSLPFVPAVALHMGWNLACEILDPFLDQAFGMLPLTAVLALGATVAGVAWLKKPCRYEEFRRAHYITEWTDRPPLMDANHVSSFPPELAETPTAAEPFFNPKPLCSILKPIGTITLTGYEDVRSTFWWLLPTSVPGYVPMNNDEQKLGVMISRVLAAPPMAPLEQLGRWTAIQPLLVPELSAGGPIIWNDVVDQWLNHFERPQQKSRYQVCLPLFMDEGPSVCFKHLTKIEVMVKVDEMLTKTGTKPMSSDIFMNLKPRAIANVHPLVQCYVGPEVYEAMNRLKAVWNMKPDPVIIGSWSIYLTYGGASTDLQLTQWAENAMMPKVSAIHILVAGDDSLVIQWRKDGSVQFYEGDFAMFDQSQSYGPLRLQWRFMKELGVSQGVLKALETLSTATYVARSKRQHSSEKVTVSLAERPLRHTGGADTTFGNSVVTAHAIVFSLLSFPENPALGFAYLGFDIKLKYPSYIGEATFLKGMWYRVDSTFGYFWGPLPSRVLKAGKSLRDPRLIFKTDDLEIAAYKFLNEVATGYASFLQVPCLRVFVRNFTSGVSKKVAVDLDHLNAFKVRPEVDDARADLNRKPKIIEWEVIDQMARRYSTDPSEIANFEEQYPTRPFTFFEHVLFIKMNEIDYN